MELPDKKRASKADKRIIQLVTAAPESVDKNDSDVKTIQTAHRGKKQRRVVVKRDDEEDAFR